MECSDFISFLTSCLISGSKESGLCFLSKHLHDAQQTGRNVHSWQTAVWSLDRRVTSRGGLAGLCFILQPFLPSAVFNEDLIVFRLKKGPRGSQPEGSGLLLRKAAVSRPMSVTSADRSADGQLRGRGPRAGGNAKGKKSVLGGNSAAPPHPHPAEG